MDFTQRDVVAFHYRAMRIEAIVLFAHGVYGAAEPELRRARYAAGENLPSIMQSNSSSASSTSPSTPRLPVAWPQFRRQRDLRNL